jgi:hypothetical protein
MLFGGLLVALIGAIGFAATTVINGTTFTAINNPSTVSTLINGTQYVATISNNIQDTPLCVGGLVSFFIGIVVAIYGIRRSSK